MAKLYSNENFDLDVVNALRARGHDVLTSYEAGNANQGLVDSFVLSYASQQERAVLTYDRRDFFRLHRETDSKHGGIIACTVDPDVEGLAARIDGAIAEAGDLAGRLLRVYRS